MSTARTSKKTKVRGVDPSAKKASRRTSGSPGAPTPDETTADRIRSYFASRRDVVEKRMFGGLCFMVAGQMCCGLTKKAFVVRVGKAGYEEALSQPHARPMDFTGRPLTGLVYVDPPGYRSDAALARWIGRGVANVSASLEGRLLARLDDAPAHRDASQNARKPRARTAPHAAKRKRAR